MAIKIDTEVTEKDFFEYHRFNILRVSLIFRIVFILFAIVLLMATYLAITSDIRTVVNVIANSWWILIMIPFLIWIQFSSIKSSYKRSSFLIEGQEYFFKDDSLQVKSGGKERIVEYKVLKKVYITGKFILLYLPSRNAFIVPKRFVNEEDLKSIIILLRDNILPEKLFILDKSLHEFNQ